MQPHLSKYGILVNVSFVEYELSSKITSTWDQMFLRHRFLIIMSPICKFGCKCHTVLINKEKKIF